MKLPDRLDRRFRHTWIMGADHRDGALELVEDVVLWIADLAERYPDMTALEYAQKMKREFSLSRDKK